MNNEKYNVTISASKQLSLMKALEIYEEEQKSNKRIIIRPEINSKKEIISIIYKAIVFVLLSIITISLSLLFNSILALIIGIIVVLIFVCLTIKKSIVSLVLLYQKFAPESLREACLFEPSCSDYMLLAIDKYGVIEGVIKGIKRLCRCHQPNGGKDYP